jgi:hypothetical protein
VGGTPVATSTTPATRGSRSTTAPIIGIYLNGVAQYVFAFQTDGNIVLYRAGGSVSWATSFTGGGFPFLANEKWRQEFSININRVRWRMWRDDWAKSYDSGSLTHSHFTANSSDTVQFRLNFNNANFSYLAVNKF